MFRPGLFSNLWIWAGIVAMMGAQMTHLPTMNCLYHTASIGWMGRVAIVPVGPILQVRRQHRGGRP